VAGKRLNIVVGEDVYVELVRRYGVRGLSKGVDQLLRAALFAGNVVNVKTDSVESAKASNVVNVKTDSVVNIETANVESAKASNVVNVKTDNVQSPVERRALEVEVPPPRIELPGRPEPPPIPAVAAAETPRDRAVEGRKAREAGAPRERAVEGQTGGAAPEEPPPAARGAGPTPKQLQLIESLLKQFGDGWETVREILLLDKGVEAPEDYRSLSGEALDKVIKALKEWARRPTARELRDARLRAQKLFEQGVDVGLPESTRDVLRYHLVKLELAEAGVLKPKK
jgi:hypothetical protein